MNSDREIKPKLGEFPLFRSCVFDLQKIFSFNKKSFFSCSSILFSQNYSRFFHTILHAVFPDKKEPPQNRPLCAICRQSPKVSQAYPNFYFYLPHPTRPDSANSVQEENCCRYKSSGTLQHRFCKYAISGCRVLYKYVCHCSRQLAVLDNRTAAHTLYDASGDF